MIVDEILKKNMNQSILKKSFEKNNEITNEFTKNRE